MSTTTIRKTRRRRAQREAGAIVRTELRQGKGNVVRRMFADIEADIYVLVDGDDTYDAGGGARADRQLIADGLDIVYRAARVHTAAGRLSRRPCAGQPLADGPDRDDVQRASVGHADRLPRHVAALREILPLHGRRLRHRDGADRACRAPDDADVRRCDTRYKERPVGSVSKLNTWRDGFRILFTIGFSCARSGR